MRRKDARLFASFLALLFNRTRDHVVSTMLGHFSFNMSLAVGGSSSRLGVYLDFGFVAEKITALFLVGRLQDVRRAQFRRNPLYLFPIPFFSDVKYYQESRKIVSSKRVFRPESTGRNVEEGTVVSRVAQTDTHHS